MIYNNKKIYNSYYDYIYIYKTKIKFLNNNLQSFIISKNINIILLSLKYNLKTNYYYITDYYHYNNNNYLIINSLLNDSKQLLSFSVNKFNKINTISNIYLNSIWLEREIKEFTQIQFIGLKDTRRLLLDYTIKFNEIIISDSKLTIKNYNNVSL